MLERLYVHNFRCLENFELSLAGKPSVLLIGKNGAGKSTISRALELLQAIARGTNRVAQLVRAKDFARGRVDAPMRFEIDVRIAERLYKYGLTLDHVPALRQIRVLREELVVDDSPCFTRALTAVTFAGASFPVDWHLIALPIMQEQDASDPLFIFKRWLAHSLMLAPIPGQIAGESTGETLEPERAVGNLGEWFAGLLAHSPAAYATIDRYVREIFPDFLDIKNPIVGGEQRSLRVQFRGENAVLPIAFTDLSDGEKCVLICALVVAANEAYGPLFCFWDEPDAHLSMSEVGHFTTSLRRAFEAGGQILMTSHNAETIRRFSDENTLLVFRRDHFEPTRVRTIASLGRSDDLVEALLRGDVEP